MPTTQENLNYFEKGKVDNPKFWKRLGGLPDFKDKTVLDVGCGHGSLCIDIARAGAKKVIGIDLNEELILFANENLKQNFPEYENQIQFKVIDLKNFDSAPAFDYIVSKDAFEHITDLSFMMKQIKMRLKPQGKILVGFGPLYNSYYGDHRRTKLLIPWAHAILPEAWILFYLKIFHKTCVSSIKELGLNKMSFRDYKSLFYNSQMKILKFDINVNDHFISKIMTRLRSIPFLEEYFTHNIYAILEKDL